LLTSFDTIALLELDPFEGKVMECIEYQILHRFFEEEHLDTKIVEGEERVRTLKPPTWYGGGKVPKGYIYREENKKLFKFDIITAVDITHIIVPRVKELARTNTKYNENITPKNASFILIPKVMGECSKRGIPQNFVPGILLLYLEHVEGCRWRHLLPHILEMKRDGLSKKDSADKWTEDMCNVVEEFITESKITPQQRANAEKQNKIYGVE
jgi:hypothetical protein